MYTHQGIGICSINAEQCDWRLGIGSSGGGIGSDTIHDGPAGELVGGSTKARLGKAGGQHGEERVPVGLNVLTVVGRGVNGVAMCN